MGKCAGARALQLPGTQLLCRERLESACELPRPVRFVIVKPVIVPRTSSYFARPNLSRVRSAGDCAVEDGEFRSNPELMHLRLERSQFPFGRSHSGEGVHLWEVD